MVIAGIAAGAAGSPESLAGRQQLNQASACTSIRTKGVEVAQILVRQLDEVVKEALRPCLQVVLRLRGCGWLRI